jgi:hypothetical protein
MPPWSRRSVPTAIGRVPAIGVAVSNTASMLVVSTGCGLTSTNA